MVFSGVRFGQKLVINSLLLGCRDALPNPESVSVDSKSRIGRMCIVHPCMDVGGLGSRIRVTDVFIFQTIEAGDGIIMIRTLT